MCNYPKGRTTISKSCLIALILENESEFASSICELKKLRNKILKIVRKKNHFLFKKVRRELLDLSGVSDCTFDYTSFYFYSKKLE